LPVGTTLVWIKRLDEAFGSFLSDAELAWVKGNHGVYCRRDTALMATANERWHATEKPIGIMRWSIEKAGGDGLILDPYAGSGTTLIAAEQTGRTCLSIGDRAPLHRCCGAALAVLHRPDRRPRGHRPDLRRHRRRTPHHGARRCRLTPPPRLNP
jgi:hypothetical protein